MLFDDVQMCTIFISLLIYLSSIMQKVLTFGEIMLRLSTPGFERFSQAGRFDVKFGGGEANVAVSTGQFRNSRKICYPFTG